MTIQMNVNHDTGEEMRIKVNGNDDQVEWK